MYPYTHGCSGHWMMSQSEVESRDSTPWQDADCRDDGDWSWASVKKEEQHQAETAPPLDETGQGGSIGFERFESDRFLGHIAQWKGRMGSPRNPYDHNAVSVDE